MGSVRAKVTIAAAIGGVVAAVPVALIALTRSDPPSAMIWLGVLAGAAIGCVGWLDRK